MGFNNNLKHTPKHTPNINPDLTLTFTLTVTLSLTSAHTLRWLDHIRSMLVTIYIYTFLSCYHLFGLMVILVHTFMTYLILHVKYVGMFCCQRQDVQYRW